MAETPKVLTPAKVQLVRDDEGNFVLLNAAGDPVAKIPESALQPVAHDGSDLTPLDSKRVLRGVKPYTYRYKADAARKLGEDRGRRVGVMAQDMQKSSPETDSVVGRGRYGLMLDGERSIGLVQGVLPDLERRLRKLEARSSRKK